MRGGVRGGREDRRRIDVVDLAAGIVAGVRPRFDPRVADGPVHDLLEAVDVVELQDMGIERRRLLAAQVPAHADFIVVDHDFGRRLDDVERTQRLRMHERGVRDVEDVVDAEQVAARDGAIAHLPGEFGRRTDPMVRDRRFVGLVRLAGPHPDEAVFLDGGEHPRARALRDRGLARNTDARAGAVVPEPVVPALEIVTDNAPAGQRNLPVRASVLEGDDLVRQRTVHDDLLIQDRPCKRLPLNFVGKCCCVPRILDKHDSSLCYRGGVVAHRTRVQAGMCLPDRFYLRATATSASPSRASAVAASRSRRPSAIRSRNSSVADCRLTQGYWKRPVV